MLFIAELVDLLNALPDNLRVMLLVMFGLVEFLRDHGCTIFEDGSIILNAVKEVI